MEMKLYSIMPLFCDNADEICDDIERQYRDGIATEALFKMTLTPEGRPVIDKASILAEQYRLFSKKLAARGLSCGILVQATIGHGYKLTTPIPFQPMVGLTDGLEKYTACPYDPAFRDYIRRAMKTLAAEKPSSIMVDDDFRLFARSYRGCTCPLHMAEISRRAGRDISRDELLQLVEQDSDEGRRMVDIFYDTQVDSLLGAARAMREGIDEVDPTIQGTFCACGDTCEGAADIAKILAGRGNPVIVRVNNGRYCSPGPRGLINSVARAAVQIAAMADSVDLFLAETDTCPQNRYSTSAASLHSHFTATILEGARGCKHWITRLKTYEPRSGEAYRRKLAKHAGFYRALSELVDGTVWQGCCIPLPAGAVRPTAPLSSHTAVYASAWASCVLEVLGLPVYYSDVRYINGPVFLDGTRDALFTDDELKKMLRGVVFMGSDTAKRLIGRGLGGYLGVDVEEFTDDAPVPTGELIDLTQTECNAQMQPQKLIPHERTAIHSSFFNLPDGKTRQIISPAVTSYRNGEGGLAVIFAGTPQAKHVFYEAFSFLNESRKAQLIHLLEQFSTPLIHYTGDAEVYLKAGRRGNQTICAIFNLSTDPLDEISLKPHHSFTKIEQLMPDGTRRKLPFSTQNDTLLIQTPALTLDPVILILSV